jgi:beta-xylosidase
LFYNRRLYCGLGYSKDGFVMHRYGLERRVGAPAQLGGRLWLRITNNRHIVTIHHSPDGKRWSKFYVQMEVSGYHHNVSYDFLSLRPGIYAAGDGEVKFRNLVYRALP